MAKAAKRELTVDEYTIKEHSIKTNDGLHTLYVQEWGNPKGVPVLYVHGGPGSGCHDGHKKVFDPSRHRAVFVDQRGTGKSEPYGSLEENTTQNLISDFEQIRELLAIRKWHLHGLSWGSTLSLCYAIEYPEIIKSIITGGIWLVSQEEVNWLMRGGYELFYPDAWERFEKLNKDNSKVDPYAYTSAFLQFLRLDDRFDVLDQEEFDSTSLDIEFYYLKNNIFLEKDHILNNADKLTIPVHIIQGRYDMVCPPKFAYALHKKLPNSTLHWTIAGHSGSDRANYDVAKALLSQIV